MKLNDFFVDWQGKVIVFEQAENVCTLWSPDGDPQEKNAIKKFSFTPGTASAEIFNKGSDPYNLMDAMQVDKLKTEPKEERTVYHVPLKEEPDTVSEIHLHSSNQYVAGWFATI